MWVIACGWQEEFYQDQYEVADWCQRSSLDLLQSNSTAPHQPSQRTNQHRSDWAVYGRHHGNLSPHQVLLNQASHFGEIEICMRDITTLRWTEPQYEPECEPEPQYEPEPEPEPEPVRRAAAPVQSFHQSSQANHRAPVMSTNLNARMPHGPRTCKKSCDMLFGLPAVR